MMRRWPGLTGNPSQIAITESFEKAMRLSSTEQNGQLIAPQAI
jgi:hypothetical protein